MTSALEKFNAGLVELENQHGSSVPLADIRQLVATTFATVPAATSAAPASSTSGVAGQCEAMTKGKDPKQCSKKASNKAPDNKCYCPQHYRINCPDAAPAPAAASSSSTPAVVAKKSSPKTTVGKGAPPPTCVYMIGGKNPRQCTSVGKNTAPDGSCYCGTHFKKFEKFEKSEPGVGVKSNNAAAETKIAAAMTQPAPQMNNDLGLAVDQNGICYLNDYEGAGICVCGLLVAGEVVDVSPETEKMVEPFGLTVIPADAREKIRTMTPQERLQFMNIEANA